MGGKKKTGQSENAPVQKVHEFRHSQGNINQSY
jgi:hypothetical protein